MIYSYLKSNSEQVKVEKDEENRGLSRSPCLKDFNRALILYLK